MKSIRFGSVCSGIEAASVAWHPLGWEAAWLSEIEPFPCAVLAHHYPDVPNLGDMTALPGRILSAEIEAPDVFCGGTPCQAFSVAGLRKSLDDARGNLSLIFCEIANAIDHVRRARNEHSAIIFWENVPGVLSTKDNAFGCFLAGLSGEDDPLLPPGGKWENAGCVFGPARTVAWRVTDAQYFGVAQRRRRVFVVASARADFDPVAVLFEFDGVRRDIAPRREARKVAPTIPSRSTAGGGLGTDFDLDGGVITTFDRQSSGSFGEAPVASTVAARDHKGPSDLISYGIPGNWIGRKPENGGNAVEPMHDVAPCLTNTDQHGVAHPIAFAQNTRDEVRLVGGDGGIVGALAAQPGMKQTTYVAQPIPFDTTQITSAANYSRPQEGDPCHPLAAGAHAPAIAFPANLSGTQCAATEDLSPAMGAKNPTAVAVALRGREGGATAELGDEIQNCLRASSGGGDKPHVLAPVIGWDNDLNASKEQMGTLLKGGDGGRHEGGMLSTMAVRRLTPVECERLQGFPDGYTQIPWRKKPASECPDGPRYKALGNSWAVPNVRWIGVRIDALLHAHSGSISAPSEAA